MRIPDNPDAGRDHAEGFIRGSFCPKIIQKPVGQRPQILTIPFAGNHDNEFIAAQTDHCPILRHTVRQNAADTHQCTVSDLVPVHIIYIFEIIQIQK